MTDDSGGNAKQRQISNQLGSRHPPLPPGQSQATMLLALPRIFTSASKYERSHDRRVERVDETLSWEQWMSSPYSKKARWPIASR